MLITLVTVKKQHIHLYTGNVLNWLNSVLLTCADVYTKSYFI